MGTLVNGIKEIFATAKTTGSNVMLCGNDGTPDGHMTMANLASVLDASKMFYTKKIEFASVDQGLVRIKVNFGNEYSTIIHTQISGGRTNGEPLDFIIGLYIDETPKYNFVSGSGNCYYKLAGGYFEIIIAQNTSIDYSVGLVHSSKEIVEAEIINRSGFDLSSYTLATDITFPQFYKNYADLSSLANALGAKRLNVRFDGDKKYVCDLYISPSGTAYLQDGYAQNIAEFPVNVLI